MIIFFNKTDGTIVGTIDGRIHPEDHLKMWVGDQNETDRLVVEWKPTKYYDQEGLEISDPQQAFTADFEPQHDQKSLFVEIEKGQKQLKDFKVNLENRHLVPI